MSYKYTLNQEDLKKVGIGALIALGGALLTYIEEIVPLVDFGDLTPLVVGFNGIIVNFLRKYLQGR